MKTILILSLLFVFLRTSYSHGIRSKSVDTVLHQKPAYSPHDNCENRQIRTSEMPDNIFNGERGGTLGWCFAHSAADVLSHRYQRKLSVHDIATHFFYSDQYQKFFKNGILGVSHPAGGMTSLAINSTDQKNVCYEHSTDYYSGDWRTQAKMMQTFSQYKIETIHIPVTPRNPFEELFKKLAPYPAEERLNYLFEATCRKKGHSINLADLRIKKWGMNSLEVEDFNMHFMENYIMINEGLMKNSKPLSIGFDMSLLYQKREGVLHAATLVGQFKDQADGICKFVIRNNSGDTCKENLEELTEGVSCDKNSDLFFVNREHAYRKIISGLWIE